VEETGTQRLEMFSDGVFAIAATLLVLEFTVNTGRHAPSLGYQLLHQLWPSYLAYATSFLTIGIIWINHHHVMETIGRVDRTFLFVNTLLLLVVAFIPFPTRLVAHYLQIPGEQAAVYAYGATLLLMAVLFNVLWAYAARNRRLIREDMLEAKVRAVTQAAAVGIPLTAVILVLAIWTPVGAMIFALAISAFYLPGAARFDRS
jgi:TMEM175 potassium channel family protein